MESPEVIHNRMKKRLNHIIHSQREYAVMKLERRLKNIELPEGFPAGSQAIFENLMESILETANTSLMVYADAMLTVVSEELATIKAKTP